MTVVAVSMVRDEADVIGSTVRHMLDQVDAVIVADNMSTDDTRLVLDSIAETTSRLFVVDDLEPAYRQSDKTTALAHHARYHFGADWIVPFDADEWWYSSFFPRIDDALDDTDPAYDIVPAELYDHVATALDNGEVDPIRRIGWRRRTPLSLPKVAARWKPGLVIEAGNHKAHYTDEAWKPWGPTALVVRHFPYRSVEQLVRKVRNGSAALRAAGDTVPERYVVHWRQWGEWLDHPDGEARLAEVFDTWYHSSDPAVDDLIYDPAP